MNRRENLHALADAYRRKHFEEGIFNLESGYLQTNVGGNDDRMPLQFFVDYNNIWWFPLLNSVEVYHVGFDEDSGTGSLAFDVEYGDGAAKVEATHGMQFVTFDETDKITFIRTFANPNFWIDNPNPVVQFDNFGNRIWLESGYSMPNSTKAAIAFLDNSPEVIRFMSIEPLSQQITTVKKNLQYYVEHNTTQWLT